MKITSAHQATRDAIIQAFRDLKNDERIKMGSPIVIFYAGWTRGRTSRSGYVDVVGTGKQDPMLAPSRTIIPPIPDRTVGSLIGGIAKVKGDNISVIFDCCHSASGTRGRDGYVDRTVELDHTINGDLDQDIVGESELGRFTPVSLVKDS
ncbi:hypothetical protein L210DRAFT_3535114, partial [Boletus edulis BED1]